MKTEILLKSMPRLVRTLVASTSVLTIMLLASQRASALNLVLNFGPNTGSTIQFNGPQSSFQFNAGDNNYQWNVTSETGGSSAMGLNASVNGGPFNIGSITTIGIEQTASVTGPTGLLDINDSAGYDLMGNVNWIDITTIGAAGGFLNLGLALNLSFNGYSGSNPDLQLLANKSGTIDASFQFAAPGMTLTDLTTGNPYSTSYSGSLTVAVPEPTTFALAGLGGLSLLLLRRQRK